MNKNESKYFSTAQKMDEALITLLEEKSLEFITVKNICEKAGVNRSTFYLHYETIQDLLSETMEYLSNQFFSYFDDSPYDVIPSISNAPLDKLVFICDKYLVPYLKYVKEHVNVFAVASSQKEIMQTDERTRDLYHYVIDPILSRFQVPEELRPFYNAFFMHGTIAIIREWLKGGCKETPEQISEIIESLCIGGRQITEHNGNIK